MFGNLTFFYAIWLFIGFVVSVSATDEMRIWKILVNFHIWPWILLMPVSKE